MSSKDNFVFESSSTDKSAAVKVKVTASRKVTLYELAEALYDYASNKDSNVFLEIEFCSCDGKTTYHFTDHAYWMNPATVLSDISRQIKI